MPPWRRGEGAGSSLHRHQERWGYYLFNCLNFSSLFFRILIRNSGLICGKVSVGAMASLKQKTKHTTSPPPPLFLSSSVCLLSLKYKHDGHEGISIIVPLKHTVFLRQPMIWLVLNLRFEDSSSVTWTTFNRAPISSLMSIHHWAGLMSLLANTQLF